MDLLKDGDISSPCETEKSEEQLNSSQIIEKASFKEPEYLENAKEQAEQNLLQNEEINAQEQSSLECEGINVQEQSSLECEGINAQEQPALENEEIKEPYLAEEAQDKSLRKKEKAGWISTAVLALICIFVAFVNFAWLYCVKVEGDSMNDTLQTGDYLVVDKLAKIKRGNVIVFTGSFAGSSEKAYIKRVVAVEGDTVRISNGNLLLQKKGEHGFTKVEYNGVKGETFYPGESGDITVPEGHLFVLGDNRENSKDSRLFGFIPLDCVDGVVHDYVIENKDGFLGKISEWVFKAREFVYIKILKRATV